MTDWKDLSKLIDSPEWEDELYRHRIHDLNYRIVYNDGSHIDGPQNYNEIKKDDVKSISALSGDKPIYTLPVNGKFLIRFRNIVKQNKQDEEFNFITPKKCLILATEEKKAFVWDDGDIDELKDWGNKEPYSKLTGW